MSTVIAKEQCPQCASQGKDNSQDNLVIYGDGGQHCFSCGYHQKEEYMEETNKNTDLIQGYYDNIPNRGLSKRTCEFYQYQIGKFTGQMQKDYVTNQTVHIANYCNQFKQPIAQKLRDSQKRFKLLGETKERSLYGQWLWESTPNLFVTVVEGELDALSIAEVQGLNFPVVSLKDGASSAKRDLKHSLEWLQGFKYVVLAFDNDDAGNKATLECLDLFEPGKVKTVAWPLKDANEMLVAGRGAEFKSLLFGAKQHAPDGILTYNDVRQQVMSQPKIGLSWPWKTLTNITYGIRQQELITVMAATGIGKTEVMSEVILHLLRQHQVKVGLMSFEQPPYKTYQRAIGKVLNKRIFVPGEYFDETEVDNVGKSIFDNQLYCYSRSGAVGWSDVRSRLIYYAKGLDCKVVIIDNLSSIAAKFDRDERRGIDLAMLELSDLVITLNITIILVCHLSRKPNTESSKAFEEGGRVKMSNARGSESIGQHSNYVFGLERNTMSEDLDIRNTLTIRCLKDREFGSGRGMYLKTKYNFENGKLEEIYD